MLKSFVEFNVWVKRESSLCSNELADIQLANVFFFHWSFLSAIMVLQGYVPCLCKL